MTIDKIKKLLIKDSKIEENQEKWYSYEKVGN